jgi:hypothetical protein
VKLPRRWWPRKQPDPKMVTAIFTFLGAVLGVVKEVIAAIRK